MRSLVLPFTLVITPLLAIGQTENSPPKVVKSAPLEMKQSGAVQTTSVSSVMVVEQPVISGDFTMSCAHPQCDQGKTLEERTRCTADAVLRHLVGQPKPERPNGLDVVRIDFEVDGYGDVKAIRSNAGSEPELGQAIIVGLSSLPKFVAARKGDARSAAHCTFSYRVDDLYLAPAPPSGTPSTTTVAPAAAASEPPLATSVKSGDHSITGVFTTPSSHAACAKGKPGTKAGDSGEDRVACTAEEVLEQIRSKLKAEAPAYMDVVVVDFDIDEYGDVKTIRANCASEPDLGKAVIVALYGMPKFIPAKKEGTRVASHCTFHYPVASLFAKP
jgi:hypothetical protein